MCMDGEYINKTNKETTPLFNKKKKYLPNDWLNNKGFYYPEKDVKQSLKNFIDDLIWASKENDWEFAHDDGNKEDGFIVISGEEFIDKKFKEHIGDLK